MVMLTLLVLTVQERTYTGSISYIQVICIMVFMHYVVMLMCLQTQEADYVQICDIPGTN